MELPKKFMSNEFNPCIGAAGKFGINFTSNNEGKPSVNIGFEQGKSNANGSIGFSESERLGGNSGPDSI